MKGKILFITLLAALILCGCGKTAPELETGIIMTAAPETGTTSVPEKTVPTTAPSVAEATTAPTEPTKEEVPVKETTAPTEERKPAVTITKNPTDETVDVGGNAVFIAKADHADKIVWIAVSPDTKTVYELDEIPEEFPGLTIEGQGTQKLTLGNIPCAMNDWRIQCYFTGIGGPAYTKGAYITVRDKKADTFDEIIDQYRTAVQSKYDAGKMTENGLNYMIPDCLEQDERARVGYYVGDVNKDGQEELLIAARSESEFYTGLIFEMYVMENGTPMLLVESSERNRWYYAGEGKLLNIASASAAESGWYLCTADRELKYLDAVECNASKYPDDPWLQYTGDTWAHIDEKTANQKNIDFGCLVTNLDISAFS